MADVKQQEPSIEEILESIRQIISDDQKPAAEAAAPPPPPAPRPAAAAAPPPPPRQEPVAPYTLTNVVEEPSDVDAILNAPPIDPNAPSIDMQDAPQTEIISTETASAAVSSMARLMMQQNMSVERDVPARVSGVTLEDITRDLLRPLLKQWLDQNLPPLVEKLVQRELEKLSRTLR